VDGGVGMRFETKADLPVCPHCGSREEVDYVGSQSNPDKYGFVPAFVCRACSEKFTGEPPDPAEVAEATTQDQPAAIDRVGPDDCPPCPCCGLANRVKFDGSTRRDGESVTQYACVPCDRGFTQDESERAAEVRRG